jgi:dihydroxyacetone kinase
MSGGFALKKLMNNPENFVNDSLKGILRAYPDKLAYHPDDLRAIFRVPQDPDKVSIITGGGYGHIPLFLGYVGDGLCDGSAVGNIFTTPSSNTIRRVAEFLPQQNGILHIFGNFLGDRINFEIAIRQMREMGVRCDQVVVSDDIMSAPRQFWTDRRCIAGIVLIYKIAGACAKRGDSLDEMLPLLNRVNENIVSVGIGLSSCHIPTTTKPIFEIVPDEMELGIGIHGEVGVRRVKMTTSRVIAADMTDMLTNDLGLTRGDRAVLLVNSMASTPKDELFILYADIHSRLDELGIQVVRSYVGEYVTSLEMSGASMTLLRYDDEYASLLDVEASSPFVSFTSLESI